MNTEESVSTREATERLVKIIDCDYAKAIPKQVLDNANHMNAEDRTHLLRLLEDFEVLFDGILGDWYKDPPTWNSSRVLDYLIVNVICSLELTRTHFTRIYNAW